MGVRLCRLLPRRKRQSRELGSVWASALGSASASCSQGLEMRQIKHSRLLQAAGDAGEHGAARALIARRVFWRWAPGPCVACVLEFSR